MDHNNTGNASAETEVWAFPQDVALFLAILLIAMGLSLLLIAAVTAERTTNPTVRVILVNLLLSSVVSSISIVFYDVFGIWGGSVGSVDATAFLAGFTVCTMIFYCGGTAHVLFATMYSVTIFLQIKLWSKPILKPRNNKYFILAAVGVWIVAFISTLPFIYLNFETTPSKLCNCQLYSIIITLLHNLFFSILPAVFSLGVLLVTVYYYKRSTLIDKCNDKGLKGLLKFGFFLLAVEIIHFVAHVILPIMFINLINRFYDDTYFSVRSVVDGIHLIMIPTPILILVFFKPARDTLTRWLTCRFRRQKCEPATSTIPL